MSHTISLSDNINFTDKRIDNLIQNIIDIQDKSLQSFTEKSKNINPITHSELMIEELRYAINEVGRITGHVDVEDFLDVIFKDFCIGK